MATTEDTRRHVLGDMVLLTGTFTAGDTDIGFGEHLSKAFAAGANPTTIVDTTVKINAGTLTKGATTITVDTTDAETILYAGQRIYVEAGTPTTPTTAMATAVIDNVASATSVVLQAPGLSQAILTNDNIHVNSGFHFTATTVRVGEINTGIDNVNKVLSINCGAAAATGVKTVATGGTWWILGQR
jgi:hypothetical protein